MKNTVPSCKKASVLGWLDFYDFLWTFCREPESKTHCTLSGFRLFPQATLLFPRRFMHASFLTDLYLECSYEICYALVIKPTCPKKNKFRFPLPISYRVNKKRNISFWTLHSRKNIKYLMLILFFIHDTH